MKANNAQKYSGIITKNEKTKAKKAWIRQLFMCFFCYAFAAIYAEKVFAQDPQFTQFFNTPVYINPAMTGTTEQWRANLLHRSQWLAIDAQYLSTTLSGEFHAPSIRSGFGVLFTHDLVGIDRSLNTSFAGSYSFYIPFRSWTARLGLQASLFYQSRDFSNLLFVSQVLPNQAPVSEAFLATDRLYADFAGGAMLYNKTFWLGLAMHHLNSPTIADLSTGFAQAPYRYSAHAGANFGFHIMSGMTYLKPAMLFKMQGAVKQFDINTRLSFEKFPLSLGVYYRDMIFLGGYRDALAFSAGWKVGDFTFTYSYDVTISGLTMASGGTHEISVVFETATLAHRRFYGVVCPVY
jgi:type IX secretion system PorP/SprF family membrane protein